MHWLLLLLNLITWPLLALRIAEVRRLKEEFWRERERNNLREILNRLPPPKDPPVQMYRLNHDRQHTSRF